MENEPLTRKKFIDVYNSLDSKAAQEYALKFLNGNDNESHITSQFLPLFILSKEGHAYNPLNQEIYRVDIYKNNPEFNPSKGEFYLFYIGGASPGDGTAISASLTNNAAVVGTRIRDIGLDIYTGRSYKKTLKKLNENEIMKYDSLVQKL